MLLSLESAQGLGFRDHRCLRRCSLCSFPDAPGDAVVTPDASYATSRALSYHTDSASQPIRVDLTVPFATVTCNSQRRLSYAAHPKASGRPSSTIARGRATPGAIMGPGYAAPRIRRGMSATIPQPAGRPRGTSSTVLYGED